MSDVMEIYICKWGQRLEDGVLEVSRDIRTRDQAEEDALEMCGKDQSIHRIVYYKVQDSGAFRLFHSFENEAAIPPDGYYRPLPQGIRPPVFIRRIGLLRRLWNWFGSL